MNRTPLIAIIVGTIVLVAWLDFSSSAQILGSILFTFPLVLCARQRSTRLLWGTAAAAVPLTIAAGIWGFHRLPSPLDAPVNQGLLIASLLTLTTFIHLWIKKSQKIVLDAAEIEGQRSSLAARNAVMEGRYRGLLEAAPDAMVVVNQGGGIELLNVQAEKQFGYLRDELLGQPVKNIIPEGFAERLIADGTRSAADALAQQIGTGIELYGRRKDGSEFPIEIMLSPLESAEGILVTAAIRDIGVRKAAEKHLAQMEGRYRGLLEAAPDAMVVVNQGGKIVLLNVQAEKQFGYRRDELVGQQVKNIIPEGFAERLIADGTRSAADALAQQIGTGIELAGRRKNGTEFPIEIMLSPLESAEGILVTAAIRDISVRKAADKHLAQMEGRYRGLLEAAPDAMVVVNQDGKMVLLNVQAEKQFGYRRDELVGQQVKNIIPEGFAERLIADGTRSAADALAQQIGTGIELYGRRKNGSEFPIEIMLSPLESAEGILVTAAIRDISVRKTAEEHLAQMEGRYRGLLEAAPDAMVVVNQSGEIVLLNVQAEKQFGYRRDELVGQRVKNIIPEGFAERLIADGTRSAADALAQQIGTGIELYGRRKDGSEFPIEIMLSPLESAEGILVTAAIRDISVRKAADKHLAQMEGKRRVGDEALRQSEEQYRMLLDGVQDAIFMVDPRGQIVSWNAGAERTKGYRADQIIGRNFSCFFPSEEIERGRPEEILRMTAAKGQHEEQGMRVRKDGSRFLASVTFTALRDAAGHLRGFCVFSHDLSESKESGAKYRGLLEAAPDAMVVVNQAGEIVLLNVQAEKQFGYKRDELVGQQVKNIIPEGFAERLIADGTRSAADALAQQIGTGIELVGRRKNGSEFPIEIMLSPLESPEGILVTAAIRDISVRKTAEKHLAQMEGRYRGLLEAAPDAMVVVNQDGKMVLLNVQAEKQFGYRRDELVGQQVKNIIPEGFAERLIADGTRSAADALAQQIGTGIELYGRRKDGSEFPIEIMLSPLESIEGTLVTAAIRDISVRKAADRHLAQMEGKRRVGEEALRQSEEQYRMLLDGIQDYAIFMMDPRGQIVSWNAGAERIKGYRADQIIGRNFSCFFPAGDIERGRPEEVLRMTAANGQHEEQGMRVRKNGSRFLASVTVTALRDPAGHLRGFSEFSHDLSESKESGAKYRGLLEAAPDAMVVVNQAGEIVLLNVQAEKQFGYRRDELIGQQVKNIVPEGFAERLIADGTRSAADALAQQIGTGIELVGRSKNGTEFPIEIMLSPLESAEGILVTAAIRDISVRKASEEHLLKTARELKRSNDELQQFAYVASHDLQEPLRMVASYTQLLAKRYKGRLDSDADEFIAYAVDGSNRMQGLIQDLLAYSRAGTGGKALRQVSSENALEEALSNLRATIEESHAVVTHDSLPAITTNDIQLAQVFQNLVGNAIKYRSTEAPRVHVSATKNGGNEWIFSVRDNGMGISPQYFERIFILFQRLHGREEFEGTGIGLAICKKILERLGGRIWVESKPEEGSTFRFALPERDAK
jgi:PAS domain S-box-containing protein